MVYSVAGQLPGPLPRPRAALPRAPPHRLDHRAGGRRARWCGRARSRWPTTASSSWTSCSSFPARRWRCSASRWRSAASPWCAPAERWSSPPTSCWWRPSTPAPAAHRGSRVRTCTCSQSRIDGYRASLSGPLLDRIDLHVEVPALAYRELARAEPGESSAPVRARVEAARDRQRQRGPGSNAAIPLVAAGRSRRPRRRSPPPARAGRREDGPVGPGPRPRPPGGPHHRRPRRQPPGPRPPPRRGAAVPRPRPGVRRADRQGIALMRWPQRRPGCVCRLDAHGRFQLAPTVG